MLNRLKRLPVMVRYIAGTVILFVFRPLTVGVRAIVVDDQRRVALVRHSYQLSHGWYLPGGGVKRGERLLQALARELREEAGVIADFADPNASPRLLGVYSNMAERKSDHIAIFVVTRFHRGTPTQRSEIAEIGWLPLDDLPGDLSPATRRRLDEYLGRASPSFDW